MAIDRREAETVEGKSQDYKDCKSWSLEEFKRACKGYTAEAQEL
jgi:hypothetical protein